MDEYELKEFMNQYDNICDRLNHKWITELEFQKQLEILFQDIYDLGFSNGKNSIEDECCESTLKNEYWEKFK